MVKLLRYVKYGDGFILVIVFLYIFFRIAFSYSSVLITWTMTCFGQLTFKTGARDGEKKVFKLIEYLLLYSVLIKNIKMEDALFAGTRWAPSQGLSSAWWLEPGPKETYAGWE